MNQLKTRLEILYNSNKIELDVYRKMLKMMDVLTKEFGLNLTEENAVMFIIHGAMALQRIAENNPVAQIDEALYRAVTSDQNYVAANELMHKLDTQIDLNIPHTEMAYFEMHLITLLQKNEEV